MKAASMTVDIEFVPRHLSGDDWKQWCESRGLDHRGEDDVWIPEWDRRLGAGVEALVYFRGAPLLALRLSDMNADEQDIALPSRRNLLGNLPVAVVRDYLEAHGWRLSARGSYARSYEKRHPSGRTRRVLVPNSEDTDDYSRFIEGAVNKIAGDEGRLPLGVYYDLWGATNSRSDD